MTTSTDTLHQLERIQAMVICARAAIGGIIDTQADAAAMLLMEADNCIFALKEAINADTVEGDPA